MSAPLKVFLAGEGKHELGTRAGHPSYTSADEPGVIESLLVRIKKDGWEVHAAKEWRRARRGVHLQVGRAHGDTKTIHALALDAIETGSDALIFVRDEDGDHARTQAVDEGKRLAARDWPHLRVAGAAAVPVLEGWLLAIAGQARTEEMSKNKAQVLAADRSITTLAGMVAVIEAADLAHLPKDATSLRSWLRQAAVVLTGAEPAG